jgi:type IX secretion system PorP/SprF family membrane protein
MRDKSKHIFFLCLCMYAGCQDAFAQDPHFSQYFSSPLTFNPAFAGYFDGTQRFTVNARTQWANVGDTHTTGTVSFDTKIMKGKIADNDRWGIGIHALYDQSSGGVFKNSYVSFSTAFNKGLDAEGDQSIGIGIQATIAHNAVDFNKISFSNQFTGSGFDLYVPNGETISNQSITYIDLNAGILYNYKIENGSQFSFGASIFHILGPRLSFFSGNNNSLARRYTFHAGGSFDVGDNNDFFVSGHIMQQGGASEYVIGGACGFGVGNSQTSLYAGGWLRAGDALYPYLSLRTPEYQFGLSYDITSSDINQSNRFTDSTEISFIYFFNADRRKKGIPCFF